MKYAGNQSKEPGRNVLILSLQVFRGFAAIAVIAHHAALSTDALVAEVPEAWMRAFDLGAFGVDFFFVLSGFIIMHAHFDQANDRASIGSYLLKRFSRIFPAYWPIGLGLIGLYVLLPDLSASGGRSFSILSSVLLLPSDQPPALSVAWTLVHEVLFYILFMTWFVSRRLFWIVLVVWVAAIIFAQVTGPATGWLRYPLSLLNIEFMIGVVVATVYRQDGIGQKAGLMIFIGAILTSVMLLLIYGGHVGSGSRLALALGFGVLILGLAVLERQQQIAYPALFLALGNASYSLYLVHNPLLSVTQRIAGKLGMGWPVGLVTGIAVSIGCGYLYYLSVERPLLRLARWRVKRSLRADN
jgi:exopolysaccharide production protein ExoZ